ncbi:ROK family protein [Nesterenkonia sp. AY15]|uniref:ROK family protein n=1 Tax=Nesterenkonia sp. AY15 TaxID=2901139 RepID=UPI001F4D03B4|nr:ROK family protein [Nesterenkonia sp. AY15]MCH8571630.1 ROK family protein [Nesterenkonia sp. AY15]
MESGQCTGPSVVLAVDIGGTTVKGSVFVEGVELSPGRTVPTFKGSLGAFDAVLAMVSGLARTARALGHEPTAIGAGTPGLVDTRAGLVCYASNLGWTNLPLGQLLEERVGVPALIDHDARTAARAEMAVRPALQDFVFIPIGTGVSGAVVTAGKTVIGARGQAGELGHVPTMPNGRPCSCGQFGCLEAYASASAVLAGYIAAGGTADSAEEVAALVGTDALADEAWSEAVNALAKGIIMLTATLDPAEIIIGGGLSAAGPVLLDPLREKVGNLLGWRDSPAISTSHAGPRAGLIGAALLGTTVQSSFSHTSQGSP